MGVIFGAIALGWLAFLMPSFLARRDGVDPDEIDPMERFGEAVRIVARSADRGLAEQDESQVSTPLLRRARRAEVALMSRTAARRRRRVVFTLLGLTVVVGSLSGFGLISWVAPITCAVVLVAFLALARFSVTRLNARLDALLAELDEEWNEDTISFQVSDVAKAEHSSELSIELSAPLATTSSLWDPIPVMAPTYVSQPLAPRTVRTIDLSAPEPSIAINRTPVVAEAPQTDESFASYMDRRAVGE